MLSAATILGLVVTSASAGGAAPLLLSEVLEQAARNDLRAQMRDEDVRIQQLLATERTLTLLPEASVSAQVVRNAREIKVGTPPDERIVTPLLVPGASGGLNITLFDAPGVPAAVAQWQRARAEAAASEEDKDRYLHDVAQRFLDLSEAQALREAYARADVLVQSQVSIAQKRLALGDATLSDVADAKSEASRLRAEAATQVGAEAALWQSIALYTGQPADAVVPDAPCDACIPPLEGERTGMPPAPLSAGAEMSLRAPEALTFRGDLEALSRSQLAARIDELSAFGKLLPTVGAAVDGTLSQPTLFRPEPFWWSARVTLSWTFFSGGRDVAGAVRQDRVAARAAMMESFSKAQGRAEVSATFALVDAGARRLAAEGERVEAARIAHDIAEKQFAGGMISGRDMTERTRALASAEVGELRARYALYRARLAARRAEGRRPLDDGERYRGGK